MRQEISCAAVPEWLESGDFSFTVEKALTDSLYYPACKFDGDPVKFFSGNIYSYVYADYAVGREELFNELECYGFRGYHVAYSQSLSAADLVPGGWTVRIMPGSGEGNPEHYKGDMKEPFCEWMIFQKNSESAPAEGVERFSLLYICADGAAAYQALYLSNQIRPRIVAILQPGHGFGFNWTDFTDRRKIFARSVFHNSELLPEYIINGGWGSEESYAEPVWPEYSNKLLSKELTNQGYLTLWGRSSDV